VESPIFVGLRKSVHSICQFNFKPKLVVTDYDRSQLPSNVDALKHKLQNVEVLLSKTRRQLCESNANCDQLKNQMRLQEQHILNICRERDHQLQLQEHRIQSVYRERDVAIEDTKSAKQELQQALNRLSQAPPQARKTVSELQSKSQRIARLSEIRNQLGPDYEVVKVDRRPEMSIEEFRAFRRFHRLTERIVYALAALPGSKWPTLAQLNRSEKQLVEQCGGFTLEHVDGIEMMWATDPMKLFCTYFENVRKTAWGGGTPDRVKLVLSADKGR
jgi:hypothetical protein